MEMTDTMRNSPPRGRARVSGADIRRWLTLGILAITLCVGLQLAFPIAARFVQAQPSPDAVLADLADHRVALWSFPPTYAEDDLILVATAASQKQSLRGIYRSNDLGDTWSDSSEGLLPKKRHYYAALAFSPDYAEDRTAWLFGHKTGLGRTEAFGGFWESTDGGATWAEVDYQGFPFRQLTQRVSQDIIGVVVSPHISEDGLMVAAAGGEGIYVTQDKGRNWDLLSPVKDVLNIYAPPTFPEEPFLALATSGNKVMISTDGGEAFAPSNEGLPEGMSAVRGIAFSQNFFEDRTMFCFGAQGVFVSEDAGQNWRTLVAAGESVSIMAMDVIGDFDTFGAIVYGDDANMVHLSVDMGQTFETIGAEDLLSYRVETVAFAPDYVTSRQLFFGGQDGLFRHGPAANVAAGETAVAEIDQVNATREARATAVSELEFVPQQSDRVETGCIAYTFAPTVFLLAVVGRRTRLWP